jgi:hypothetical protein
VSERRIDQDQRNSHVTSAVTNQATKMSLMRCARRSRDACACPNSGDTLHTSNCMWTVADSLHVCSSWWRDDRLHIGPQRERAASAVERVSKIKSDVGPGSKKMRSFCERNVTPHRPMLDSRERVKDPLRPDKHCNARPRDTHSQCTYLCNYCPPASGASSIIKRCHLVEP